MRARTSLLLGRTRTDAIGICCVVYPANGQSRITPSLPCQFPITTRSTAPMAHFGRFGKRIGINEMTGRIRQRPSQLQHSFAVNFGAFGIADLGKSGGTPPHSKTWPSSRCSISRLLLE